MLMFLPIPEPQYRGNQQLPDSKGDTHQPWREQRVLAAGCNADQSTSKVPHADQKHLAWQEPAGGKYTQAEYHLPKARQHPDAVGREADDHHRQQQTGRQGGQKLLGRTVDHFGCEAAMNAPGSKDGLDPRQCQRYRGSGDPDRKVAPEIVARNFEPMRLSRSDEQGDESGSRHRRRPVAVKLGAARDLRSDGAYLGKGFVEISHAAHHFTGESKIDSARNHNRFYNVGTNAEYCKSPSADRANAQEMLRMSGVLTVEPRGEILAVRFAAMASPCEVLLSEVEPRAALAIGTIAADEALRIEQKFSRYRDDSVTARIHERRGTSVELDQETASLIDFAGQCFE